MASSLPPTAGASPQKPRTACEARVTSHSPEAPSAEALLALDRQLCWHPYATLPGDEPRYLVDGAEGCYLTLSDGRRLIDGMSSWWSAILGHRHPRAMAAAHQQLDTLPHVMFGGLTHAPAVRLAERLVQRAPGDLSHVFFCDSGSVSVEVAMKMAVQAALGRGESGRTRFLALRHGYHGDTWGAMSVCDPDLSLHRHFRGALIEQVFAPAPPTTNGSLWDDSGVDESLSALEASIDVCASELCALVLEPIVQGAGGMRFYSPRYLAGARRLCDRYGLLLIADEIATGFGRTGRYFACEHAGVQPDILCVGKALTGGTLSLAATLTTPAVRRSIASGHPGALMHGPTFMANPLACSVALAVLDALDSLSWPERVAAIEAQLRRELAPCRGRPGVSDVRVLGAIGVVETTEAIELAEMVPRLVDRGVWLRPFGKLLYTMPPFVIEPDELSRITAAMREAVGVDG